MLPLTLQCFLRKDKVLTLKGSSYAEALTCGLNDTNVQIDTGNLQTLEEALTKKDQKEIKKQLTSLGILKQLTLKDRARSMLTSSSTLLKNFCEKYDEPAKCTKSAAKDAIDGLVKLQEQIKDDEQRLRECQDLTNWLTNLLNNGECGKLYLNTELNNVMNQFINSAWVKMIKLHPVLNEFINRYNDKTDENSAIEASTYLSGNRVYSGYRSILANNFKTLLRTGSLPSLPPDFPQNDEYVKQTIQIFQNFSSQGWLTSSIHEKLRVEVQNLMRCTQGLEFRSKLHTCLALKNKLPNVYNKLVEISEPGGDPPENYTFSTNDFDGILNEIDIKKLNDLIPTLTISLNDYKTVDSYAKLSEFLRIMDKKDINKSSEICDFFGHLIEARDNGKEGTYELEEFKEVIKDEDKSYRETLEKIYTNTYNKLNKKTG